MKCALFTTIMITPQHTSCTLLWLNQWFCIPSYGDTINNHHLCYYTEYKTNFYLCCYKSLFLVSNIIFLFLTEIKESRNSCEHPHNEDEKTTLRQREWIQGKTCWSKAERDKVTEKENTQKGGGLHILAQKM